MDMTRRNEWLRLMNELAGLDREAFRVLRMEAWQRVAVRHASKTPAEIAVWEQGAS